MTLTIGYDAVACIRAQRSPGKQVLEYPELKRRRALALLEDYVAKKAGWSAEERMNWLDKVGLTPLPRTNVLMFSSSSSPDSLLKRYTHSTTHGRRGSLSRRISKHTSLTLALHMGGNHLSFRRLSAKEWWRSFEPRICGGNSCPK